MESPSETSIVPPALPSAKGVGTALVACPICRMELDPDQGPEVRCGYCGAVSHLEVFPRLNREQPAEPPSPPAGGEEATCQFFPSLRAELYCDECGCFMSRKAATRWGRRDICMPCLHTLREVKKDPEFRGTLKLWDNRALGWLSLLPFTLFTAPLALFQLIRYRREPHGWVPRSSFRWWLGLILSILILLGWVVLITIWVAMVVEDLK